MKRFVGLLGVLFLVSSVFAASFPLRNKFPQARPISTEELLARLDQAIIVDVRPRIEYDIFHIQGAHHIPLESLTREDLLNLRPQLDPRFGFLL